MTSSELRINARLTGEDARRFRELQKREGLSASDLLRDALRAYHAERMRPRVSPAKLLSNGGFIGGGEGPADLSVRYKEYLTEAFENTLPTRVHGR